MVIDPLTQGHQFDHRIKFFSLSWSTAHPLKFDMPHDHVQKIKFLTSPQSPRGWGTQEIVPVHVPFMAVTHQIWLNFGEKKILPPNPPWYPQVPPLGMTQATDGKSRLICYISFICEKIHKVWFKNLEIDFVIEI